MTDERRPRTPWLVWLFLAIAALFALRFALHTVAHVIDLASTVAVLAVAGFVGWKVAVGGRRRRPRDRQGE